MTLERFFKRAHANVVTDSNTSFTKAHCSTAVNSKWCYRKQTKHRAHEIHTGDGGSLAHATGVKYLLKNIQC